MRGARRPRYPGFAGASKASGRAGRELERSEIGERNIAGGDAFVARRNARERRKTDFAGHRGRDNHNVGTAVEACARGEVLGVLRRHFDRDDLSGTSARLGDRKDANIGADIKDGLAGDGFEKTPPPTSGS
jgi:hypothetical protein